MARPIRDPRLRRERPGQKPLLQGHLARAGRRLGDAPRGDTAPRPKASPVGSVQPAEDLASATNEGEAARGKATKSPADVATRPHLEGSDQGPA